MMAHSISWEDDSEAEALAVPGVGKAYALTSIE